MRRLLFLTLVLYCTGCSIGGGVPDVDPTGHWVPVDSDAETEFDVVAGPGKGFTAKSLISDLVDLQMTVKGKNFTMTGFELTEEQDGRTDYLVTGSIEGDTMTGALKITFTDLTTRESFAVPDMNFTAHRNVGTTDA